MTKGREEVSVPAGCPKGAGEVIQESNQVVMPQLPGMTPAVKADVPQNPGAVRFLGAPGVQAPDGVPDLIHEFHVCPPWPVPGNQPDCPGLGAGAIDRCQEKLRARQQESAQSASFSDRRACQQADPPDHAPGRTRQQSSGSLVLCPGKATKEVLDRGEKEKRGKSAGISSAGGGYGSCCDLQYAEDRRAGYQDVRRRNGKLG